MQNVNSRCRSSFFIVANVKILQLRNLGPQNPLRNTKIILKQSIKQLVILLFLLKSRQKTIIQVGIQALMYIHSRNNWPTSLRWITNSATCNYISCGKQSSSDVKKDQWFIGVYVPKIVRPFLHQCSLSLGCVKDVYEFTHKYFFLGRRRYAITFFHILKIERTNSLLPKNEENLKEHTEMMLFSFISRLLLYLESAIIYLNTHFFRNKITRKVKTLSLRFVLSRLDNFCLRFSLKSKASVYNLRRLWRHLLNCI